MEKSNVPISNRTNPFTMKAIPSVSQLCQWSTDLSKANIEAGNHYVEFEYGKLMNDDILHLLSLHRVKDCREAVKKEMAWNNETYLIPRNVEHLSIDSIRKFQKLIWDTPTKNILPTYDMLPGTLAELCVTRHLSSDHVLWWVKKLNSTSDTHHFIYLNFIGQIQRYVARNIDRENRPSYLCFIINVGKNDNGDVHIGTDQMQGCHWTICVFHSTTGEAVYGDSAGWDIPTQAIDIIKSFIDMTFEIQWVPNVRLCHDPITHSQGLRCSSNCSLSYPLQKCGNICGVVVIIVACISVHNIDLFHKMTSRTCSLPYLFLKEPTKFSKYLRSTVSCWYAENEVNIRNIWNVQNDDASSVESDSDSDTDIPRCDMKDRTVSSDDGNHDPSPPSMIQCPLCSQVFSRGFNLRRHLSSKHKDREDLLEQHQKGNSICLECGTKFRRIHDLRQHLVKQHAFCLRQEVVRFENKAGMSLTFIT